MRRGPSKKLPEIEVPTGESESEQSVKLGCDIQKLASLQSASQDSDIPPKNSSEKLEVLFYERPESPDDQRVVNADCSLAKSSPTAVRRPQHSLIEPGKIGAPIRSPSYTAPYSSLVTRPQSCVVIGYVVILLYLTMMGLVRIS